MVKTQTPGFYRMMLGDFEVTALYDGSLPLAVDTLLTNTSPTRVKRALDRWYLKEPVDTSVNGYLINTGAKLVLVDAGTGTLFGPTLGKLIGSMQAAGYQPEQVDEVYVTHMHADHVGGLMAGDKLAFPNAIVRADKHDADFWLSQANMDAAPKDAKGFFKGAMASINPYIAAGKFKPFDGDTDLTPGQGHGESRPYARAHDLRGREQRLQARVVGRPDARRGGAICGSVGHHQIRHGFQGRCRATQARLRRSGAQGLLGGRRAPCVPRHRARADRRQRLRMDSSELCAASLNALEVERIARR
jgi:glyoxylase-like metal-dependent hydrolase (beta-lactamase superfamily II)